MSAVELARGRPILESQFRKAPHPVPLPIQRGEGGRRPGEGCFPFYPEMIYENRYKR